MFSAVMSNTKKEENEEEIPPLFLISAEEYEETIQKINENFAGYLYMDSELRKDDT